MHDVVINRRKRCGQATGPRLFASRCTRLSYSGPEESGFCYPQASHWMPWKEAVQLTVLKKQAARYPASIPMIAYCYGRGFMFEVGEVETAAAAVFDGSLVAVARRSPGLVVFGAE